jgi:hypothetical protein
MAKSGPTTVASERTGVRATPFNYLEQTLTLKAGGSMESSVRRWQAALFFLLSSGCAMAAETSWRTYVNPRFGVAVDYPPFFTREDPPPDNGDGQTFRTQRGEAVLKVFGSYNVDNEKSDRLMAAQKRSDVAYTYERAAKTWFVLSGTRNGQISYTRCNLGGDGSDVLGCLELEYPSTDAAHWNDVVVRLAESLRFGQPQR